MRQVGYSTGALAYADFRRGLAMLRGRDITAVELSALRQSELQPLVEAPDDLDLRQFSYVSFHAPSRILESEEKLVVQALERVWKRDWPIILHPDAIHDFSLWRRFGATLYVENMDKRKPGGRSVDELNAVFRELPDASFCFDIGHARQYDSSMTQAYMMLREFGGRLRQVHVSEVNTSSRHDLLSYTSVLAFQEVAGLVPPEVPLILETPVHEEELEAEIERAREALPLNSPVLAG
jgi:hypothetical protein